MLHDWGIRDLFDVYFAPATKAWSNPIAASYQAFYSAEGETESSFSFDDTLDHCAGCRRLGLRGPVHHAEALEEQLADLV